MKRADLQQVVISGMAEKLGIQPYRANQRLDVPEGPHIVFSYLTSRGYVSGENVSYTRKLTGLGMRIVRDVTRTISFTAVADEDITAMDLAEEAHKCFTDYMRRELSYAGIVVEMITDVAPRTAIDDDIEGRAGFDVRLRAAEVVDINEVPYFDKIKGGLTQNG